MIRALLRASLPRRPGAAVLVLASLASSAGAAGEAEVPGGAAQPAPKRVLIVQSFGSDYAPFAHLAATFRARLTEEWPAPLDLYDIPLALARFESLPDQDPFVGYLLALFAERPVDLVVSIGGPAASFCLAHRERLFPSAALLLAGVDRRFLENAALTAADATVPLVFDPPAVVENILQVRPDTEQIAVVLGASPLERFWRQEIARDLRPFADRVRFIWLDELSFAELRRRVALLPPHTAIFYALFLVDATGSSYASDAALASLRAVANAPIFGDVDTQLGNGIVGGPLLPIGAAADAAVEVAKSLLGGDLPSRHRLAPIAAGPPTFDARELERWDIDQARLPPGSVLRFPPVMPWSEHRRTLLAGLAIVGVQASLIVGLLVHRARRRSAEAEATALRRSMTRVYEQERRRLARELHDDVSQRLARLCIDAARVERSDPRVGREVLTAMRGELARLTDDVHVLSRRLHPSLVDDLGLTEALRAEVEHVVEADSLKVELQIPALAGAPPSEVAVCLFRVAQEALRNVVRHARATRADVALRAMDEGLELVVSDDGCGFDPFAHRRQGLGLVSLRERLDLAGGKLEVDSAPGRGTRLRAWAPLRSGES